MEYGMLLHSEEEEASEEASAHLEQQTSQLLAEAERLFVAMPPGCASAFVGDSLLSCHDDDGADDGVDDGRHGKSRELVQQELVQQELVQHLRQGIAGSTLPHASHPPMPHASEEAGWSGTSRYIGRALVRSHPLLRACSSRGHSTHAMTP